MNIEINKILKENIEKNINLKLKEENKKKQLETLMFQEESIKYRKKCGKLTIENKELKKRLDLTIETLTKIRDKMKWQNKYNRNFYTIKKIDDIINIIKGEQKDDN